MPRAKQRPSVATIVSKSTLEQASVSLQALPDKPKEVWSLRETVMLLQDDITSALNRGYTYDEIVKVLADKEIGITASSLKRYLATARRDRGNGAVRRTRQSRSSQALAAQPATTVVAPVPSAQPRSSPTGRQATAAKVKTTPRASSRTRRRAGN
jgi:hypothetical protein